MKAVQLIAEGKFGNMVALKGNKITYASLEDVIGKIKNVSVDDELIEVARKIGTSFGD